MPFKKDKLFISLIAALLILAFVPFFAFNKKNVLAQIGNKDAIAIRVIPNSEHYSAMRWYANQKFTGSPQGLLVDGYSAVRDGRTVYVNVANISSGDNTIYTNIYLITCNQEAEKATEDIFGNILKNWRFNANISDRGHCRGDSSIVCSLDEECAIGDFCDSRKALIARDVRRLEDLAEMKVGLESVFARSGYYPRLAAGTYLPNKSLSVWPSWRSQLQSETGIVFSIDPVNSLGKCCFPGAGFSCNSAGIYNAKTCWDENKKIFATNLPSVLPDSSLAYIYNSNPTGSSYSLCAVMESGLAIGGNQLIASACPRPCLDMDYDGYGLFANSECAHSAADCDDTNRLVAAGSAENCINKIDDDCDGLADCFDSDCAVNPVCSATSICSVNNICEAGETCSNCPSDCCCGDGFCNNSIECPGKSFYCSADCKCGNGRKDCGEECDGGASCNPDCTIKPFSCTDTDRDRYIKENTVISACGAVCGNGMQVCLGNNDCDDAKNNVFPGKSEECDGLDNDCNGTPDNGFTEESCGFLCSFNYNSARSGALRCCGDDVKEAGPYEMVERSCADGKDNDCDGTFDNDVANIANPDTDCLSCDAGNSTSEKFWFLFSQGDCNQCDHAGDDDGDQFGEDWSAYLAMADKCDKDCGTVLFNVPRAKYEHANELSCDGIDNDCDGEIDENVKTIFYKDKDGDSFGNPSLIGSYCPADKPVDYVANNQDCDDLESNIRPGAAEVCADSIDNNCNGNIDEGCVMNTYCLDADGDGFGNPAIVASAPSAPIGHVIDCTDCNDASVHAKPGGAETCDGLDNDCSGDSDDGCDNDGDDYCDAIMPFYNYPIAVCPLSNLFNGSMGNDCDDADNARHPGAMEICDGKDNDCNNATPDGSGESLYEAGTEVSCSDGKDNDCDGKTDVNDPDCPSFCVFNFTLPCVLN